MILGVCQWLGLEVFNVEPNAIRVIFVVAALGFGTGIVIYLVIWLIKIYQERNQY